MAETLSNKGPVRLAKDQHLHSPKGGSVDLALGFTWCATIYAELEPDTTDEQVIFDIGAEGGIDSQRIQLLVRPKSELVFRVRDHAIVVPGADIHLDRQWHPVAVSALVAEQKLTLRLMVDHAGVWQQSFDFSGDPRFGSAMRIGQALSGGRGIKLGLLDVTAWAVFQDEAKLSALFEVLRERPAEFDVQHGLN